VACGNEIKSVVNAVERFNRWPMGKIDQTHMWQVGGWVDRLSAVQLAVQLAMQLAVQLAVHKFLQAYICRPAPSRPNPFRLSICD
jgi:hypothetical protein